jgi:hypothetical protein
MSEEQRGYLQKALEDRNIKFSGCHIFQMANPLQNIRMIYGDVKVCFVRFPSTVLLFDQVYRDYCSIVAYLLATRNPFLYYAPLLRVYFVDGCLEGWEEYVAAYIQSDKKQTLIVLESVIFQEACQVHYDRIERILALLDRDGPQAPQNEAAAEAATTSPEQALEQDRAPPHAPAFGTPILSQKRRQRARRRHDRPNHP